MSQLPDFQTRREFLKKSAVAANAFYIMPRFVLGGRDYSRSATSS